MQVPMTSLMTPFGMPFIRQSQELPSRIFFQAVGGRPRFMITWPSKGLQPFWVGLTKVNQTEA